MTVICASLASSLRANTFATIVPPTPPPTMTIC
jgi:hypothetical protein